MPTTVRPVRHRTPWLLALALLPLAACGSTSTETIDVASVARWTSRTDAASRAAIRRSFEEAVHESHDYRIGPEDVLSVSIFEWELRDETRTLDVRVSRVGAIELPTIGAVVAAGRTTGDVRVAIESRLREGDILKNPRVSVEVKAYRSRRVSVVGAVREPGVYTLQTNVTTLLDVIALAGGASEQAGQVAYVIRQELVRGRASDTVVVAEGAELRVTIDLFELMELGNLDLNMVLASGDVVHIPEAEQFYVRGFVREPGGFPLKRPTTVLDAVALASGLIPREASPTSCVLKRRDASGERIIPVNLVAVSDGEEPNRYLEPGDILEVKQTARRSILLGIWDTIKAMVGVPLGAIV